MTSCPVTFCSVNIWLFFSKITLWRVYVFIDKSIWSNFITKFVLARINTGKVHQKVTISTSQFSFRKIYYFKVLNHIKRISEHLFSILNINHDQWLLWHIQPKCLVFNMVHLWSLIQNYSLFCYFTELVIFQIVIYNVGSKFGLVDAWWNYHVYQFWSSYDSLSLLLLERLLISQSGINYHVVH